MPSFVDQQKSPVQPVAGAVNTVKITPVKTSRVRVVFTHRKGSFAGMTEMEVWGEHFVSAIGPDGLPASATSRLIVMRSNLGYTGTEPRTQLLQNSRFVDARVEVFGKQGRRNWVKLGAFAIDRQLLTQ